MTQEGGVPRDFWGRIEKMIADAVAKLARSGMLRNATISDGGLTIKGGFFKLVAGATSLFYVGPVGDVLGNGLRQQVWQLRRADGTLALSVFDAAPDPDGTLNQAVNWRDRSGNSVLADDTDSGQGMARPYLAGGFGRARFADMSVATTATTFETLWTARVTKQQPRLFVAYKATGDAAGVTGETRVMVNGVQLGATATESFLLTTRYLGPAAVAGAHMSDLIVEIQARVTSASGAVRVEALGWEGRQT